MAVYPATQSTAFLTALKQAGFFAAALKTLLRSYRRNPSRGVFVAIEWKAKWEHSVSEYLHGRSLLLALRVRGRVAITVGKGG